MNDRTLAIVRFLAATFAGISGYFFSGNLGIEAQVPLNKFQIRATGAFATFIITFFFFFVGIPSSSQQYLETQGSSLEKFSDPEQFKNKIFSCKTVDGIPTTFMKISGGQNEHPFILWVSVPEFYDSTYTPDKRCQEVSKRFQKTYEEGLLESIYSGEFAGYPAICASEIPQVTEEIKFKSCTEENILIILRPSDNPKQIIKRFATVNESSYSLPVSL